MIPENVLKRVNTILWSLRLGKEDHTSQTKAGFHVDWLQKAKSSLSVEDCKKCKSLRLFDLFILSFKRNKKLLTDFFSRNPNPDFIDLNSFCVLKDRFSKKDKVDENEPLKIPKPYIDR